MTLPTSGYTPNKLIYTFHSSVLTFTLEPKPDVFTDPLTNLEPCIPHIEAALEDLASTLMSQVPGVTGAVVYKHIEAQYPAETVFELPGTS